MTTKQNAVTVILNKLEDVDLFGLSATVTQGFLKNKLKIREEAIEAILKYSADEVVILKRKAVTRDVLFSYLHDNNVQISLPATKADLIERILEFWDEHDVCDAEKVAQVEIVSSSCNAVEETPNVNMLAMKFAEWFYQIMNSNEPIGQEHFWPDCTLKINISPLGVMQMAESAQEVAAVLFGAKCTHNLYFNPNLTCEGIQGRMDPHGLVMVLACGTLHVNSEVVGVYEQVFSLARDPYADNNWKIKNSELNLRSKNNVLQPPSLKENELTGNLLALPQN